MEAILVKVFATALALSQVTTRPEAVKLQFDPAADQAEVVQLLTAGCAHMRKAFDIENLDIDDLIETAMNDKRTVAGEVKAFRGIKFADLHVAYRQFCKKEKIDTPVVDIGAVIEFYNRTATDLPDHGTLKGLRLPGVSAVLDAKGAPFAELFEPNHRRWRVSLSDIPVHVRQAFVAAEDKRFYKHRGIDERSVIRAFIATVGDSGRRQGGSTITQQVAKNLLVGNEISYERKIREIIVASRVEQTLSKDEILEIYLNAIFLGRGSWGIEMAARSYFGKSAKELTVTEGAFLAGLAKGPNYYNPDRQRERAHERLAYVLGRMQEDGAIDEAQVKAALGERLAIASYARPRRDTGFHLVEHLTREAKSMAGLVSLTFDSYTVRSTINPQLQRAAEAALQEGLARYEQSAGRVRFDSAEMNLGDAIRRLQASPRTDSAKPVWLQALEAARPPLYDVHWATAVVVEKGRQKGGYDAIMVGLRDGRVLPLSTFGANTRRNLNVNDLIYVRVFDGTGKQGTRVELRARPTVQGAAVVLENATGRILAMTGGFSFPLSQLNRATQARRQPGSALKPLTYLAALSSGLQPNTVIQDGPITLPPIGMRGSIYSNSYSAKDWWSPKNYDGGYSGSMTLRRALENSKNLVTAHLLQGGIASSPEQSLDTICRLAMEAQLYAQCERYYPFILGAQHLRVIDLAAFYAAVANEGARPTPHVIESIEQDGKVVYQNQNRPVWIGSTDRPAAYQLKTILQGVLARGTARSIGALSPYVGGKTGTSDDENDAWFIGFSNDVTVAVWVGYDNARGKRTLGHGATGGRVAVPIFEPIMQASWNVYPKTALRGPSPDAQRRLVALPIDLHSGVRLHGRSNGSFVEHFRLDATGRMVDTQHRLMSQDSIYMVEHGANYWTNRSVYDNGPYTTRRVYREPETPSFFAPLFGPFRQPEPQVQVQPQYRTPPAQSRQSAPPSSGYYQEERPAQQQQPRTRRVDPDFFWGQRRAY